MSSEGNGVFEKMLDQKAVADILGVSVKTLECWRWKRIGPKFFKVGRLARYRESDLITYIQNLVEKTTTNN